MRQQYFLELAKKISERSDHHKYKMGCVIARGRKVLGSGFNMTKTHPKSPHCHRQVHAEFMAALSANLMEIEGATAYIFRQQKDGTWAIARPCKYCMSFLKKCGIKEVIYSFEGSFRTEEL